MNALVASPLGALYFRTGIVSDAGSYCLLAHWLLGCVSLWPSLIIHPQFPGLVGAALKQGLQIQVGAVATT